MDLADPPGTPGLYNQLISRQGHPDAALSTSMVIWQSLNKAEYLSVIEENAIVQRPPAPR